MGGLTVAVFRWELGDCTNGGISATHGHLCVVNIPGPSEPTDDKPAVLLEDGPRNTKRIVPAVKVGDDWIAERREGSVGPMAGGNYAATSDSRWSAAVGFYGAVSIHDRFETAAQYEAMSQ